MSGNGNAVDWFVDRHEREGRGAAMAFRDPWRSLSYGELAVATRRFAGALRAAGVARERRVAMLLLDTVDFPIAFWGAIRAGVVPVPINTLLTHEVVGYILADSRADALVISAPLVAPLLPVLHSLAELRRIIVAQPDGGAFAAIDDPRAVGFAEFLAGGDPATPTAVTPADEVAFWLYSSGSTGAPKGVRHVHGSLRATADTYGAQVLADPRGRPDVLRGEGVPCLRARQCHDLPDVGRRRRPCCCPTGRRPMRCSTRWQRHQPTIFAGVPTLFASMLANPRIGPGAGSARLRRCISAGEALPDDIGRRWFEHGRRGHPRRHRLDRDAAHLRLQPRRRRPLRHLGQAGAGLRGDDPGRARRPRAEWRGRRTGGARSVARPRATGTSATRRAARSAASGRIPATPISAMPTATTASAAAPTRC